MQCPNFEKGAYTVHLRIVKNSSWKIHIFTFLDEHSYVVMQMLEIRHSITKNEMNILGVTWIIPQRDSIKSERGKRACVVPYKSGEWSTTNSKSYGKTLGVASKRKNARGMKREFSQKRTEWLDPGLDDSRGLCKASDKWFERREYFVVEPRRWNFSEPLLRSRANSRDSLSLSLSQLPTRETLTGSWISLTTIWY